MTAEWPQGSESLASEYGQSYSGSGYVPQGAVPQGAVQQYQHASAYYSQGAEWPTSLKLANQGTDGQRKPTRRITRLNARRCTRRKQPIVYAAAATSQSDGDASQPPSNTAFPPAQFGQTAHATRIGHPDLYRGSGTATHFRRLGQTLSLLAQRSRVADLIVNGYPGKNRDALMFGGAVNSDAGVTGQITIDERNFDITRWPRSVRDLFSGTAFRGAGQTFRAEAALQVATSTDTRSSLPIQTLFGYMPDELFGERVSLYDRRYPDWDENRLGAADSLSVIGSRPDLSVSQPESVDNASEFEQYPSRRNS